MVRRLERHKPHIKYLTSHGKQVVGASTIAGINKPVDPLMGWAARLAKEGKDWRKERDTTSGYGDVAHFLIECHLSGDEPDLEEFSKDEIEIGTIAYEKFLRYWDKNRIEVVDQEVQLVSDELKFGGTIDLIGRDPNGKLILYDWKTSKAIYESHIMQAVGYKHLWEHQNTDDMLIKINVDPIERVCIVRVGRNGKEVDAEPYWVPQDMVPKYWECFKARLQVYYADKEIK